MGRFGLGVGMCRRDAFDEIVVERDKRQQEATFNLETFDLVVVNDEFIRCSDDDAQ